MRSVLTANFVGEEGEMSDKLSSRRALGPRRFGRAHHAAWRAGVAARLRKLRAPVA